MPNQTRPTFAWWNDDAIFGFVIGTLLALANKRPGVLGGVKLQASLPLAAGLVCRFPSSKGADVL